MSNKDYQALADLRFRLRRFLRYSERAAEEAGLTPKHHQALLAIRAGPGRSLPVGGLAERLFLKPHSASELVKRLEAQHLIRRKNDENDKRQVVLQLTERAETVLAYLSQSHRAELRRLRPMLKQLLSELG